MAAGFLIDWTVWRVWRHPKMACHALDQLTTDLMTTDEKLRETLDMLEEQRRESVRLTVSLTELSERLIAKDNELVAVKRELDMTRADLAEHISVDEKIAQFNKQLLQFESIKRNYEKTINMLRGRLEDARRRLGEKDNYDLFETIHMDAPAPPPPPIKKEKPPKKQEGPAFRKKSESIKSESELSADEPVDDIRDTAAEVENDWLDDTPTKRDAEVGRLDAALRRKKPAKDPAPGELRVPPGKTDEDDWLIPLSNDL